MHVASSLLQRNKAIGELYFCNLAHIMLKDGWLNEYLVEIEGTKYLDLKPAKKPHLAEHMAGIAQWRPNGVLHGNR